jgi:hypothetical protein
MIRWQWKVQTSWEPSSCSSSSVSSSLSCNVNGHVTLNFESFSENRKAPHRLLFGCLVFLPMMNWWIVRRVNDETNDICLLIIINVLMNVRMKCDFSKKVQSVRDGCQRTILNRFFFRSLFIDLYCHYVDIILILKCLLLSKFDRFFENELKFVCSTLNQTKYNEYHCKYGRKLRL